MAGINPPYRCTLFFQNADAYGWTEQHWYGGGTTLDVFRPQADILVRTRAAVLTTDCFITRVRLDTSVKRMPQVLDYAGVDYATGQWPGVVNSSDDCVILRYVNYGIGVNRTFLRGIPDAMVTSDEFKPTPDYSFALQSYVTAATGPNWFVVAQMGNPQPPINGGSMVQGNPKGIRLTLPTPLPSPLPASVRISGASIIGYNGVKNVLADVTVTGGTPTYQLGGARPPANNPSGDFVKVVPLVYSSGSVQQTSLDQFTLRKPGRPFGLRAGRARTKLSLRP
jgi:hypothetical protein